MTALATVQSPLDWHISQPGQCPCPLRAKIVVAVDGRVLGPVEAQALDWTHARPWMLAEDFEGEIEAEAKPQPLACGVHFDAPDERYFISGIGSTDLVKLARTPADWWYSSNHNPDRIDTAKRDLDFGTALHALVLQGLDAFERVVAVSPHAEFRTDKAKAWKSEQIDADKAILQPAEAKAVQHMASLILHHPDTAAIGTGLRELAVVWEEDGVRFRAKFDAILPAFSIDLKTYGGANTQGRSPKDTAMRMIAMRNYDVQRAHYHTARERLRDAVAAGRVFGGTPTQRAMLAAIAERKTWAWVWLFYQRRDDKAGHAPVIMPIAAMPEDPSHESGRRKIATALANYRAYVARFGLDTPWAQINRLTWAEPTDFVPWMSDVAPPQFEGEDA